MEYCGCQAADKGAAVLGRGHGRGVAPGAGEVLGRPLIGCRRDELGSCLFKSDERADGLMPDESSAMMLTAHWLHEG
jgi:hypothetical protein